VAPVAKILKLFAAEFKIGALKIGVVDKEILSTSDVEALAELPSREILLSRLLGLLLAPATQLVRVLNEPASAFARLLSAKADKEKAAAPAAPEAPAAEAPAPSAPEAPASEAPESKQEAPVAEAKVETPAAEQTPAAATEAPAAEPPTGETAPENPA
jgi:hypothetical protein